MQMQQFDRVQLHTTNSEQNLLGVNKAAHNELGGTKNSLNWPTFKTARI